MPSLYRYYTERLEGRPAGRFFLWVMNILLILALALWTLGGLIILPFAFIFLRFIGRRTTPWIIRLAIWVYGRVWQGFTRVFVTFEPVQYLPSQFSIPGIIVVNHRSFFDTYCMNMLPVSDVCFAVRDWPFKIPVYSIFMKMAAYINIEKFSWEESVARSRETLGNEGFVLFFPEGHRSRTKAMTRFYSGAFKMAVETNTPIIPVCLIGTEDLLPPDRRYMAPARIKMRVLDPVFPDEFTGKIGHQALRKKVKELMEDELLSMDADENLNLKN